MKKRKCCFITNFILMCLVLYIIHSYLNSLYTWNCCRFLFESEKSPAISSIVVYSNKNIIQNKRCNNFNKTLIISNINKEWQKVDDTKIFLYSAYTDDRIKGQKLIRIIAMSKGMFRQTIFCNVWTTNNGMVYFNEIDIQELWVTSWDMATTEQYYRPLLLSCEVDDNIVPLAITVTTKPCKHSNNIVLLNKTNFKSKLQQDFIVCLKPLNFNNDITNKLIEWLELQFLLEADKVAVYVNTLPLKILNILKYYEEQGKVTIKYISLLDAEETIQNSEQRLWQKRRYEMAFYNDCFYNHIYTHKVVVNLDLDEAIIPIKTNSWKALLEQAKKYSPNIFQFASISAPNVYFFDSFGEESDESIPEYAYMLRHLMRSSNFTPPGFAQKSFFLTNNTLTVTNHYALKSLHYFIKTNTALKKDIVQLHHYRSSCPPKMEKECQENYMKYTIKDPIILKFKDKLIKQIGKRLVDLKLL